MATPRNPNQASTEMKMSMPLIAPLFVQYDGYESSITMVNELTALVHGTVIATAPDGSSLRPKSTYVSGTQSGFVESFRATQQPERGPHPRSLELDPNPSEVTSMALAAQLSIVDNRTVPATYLEEEFITVDPMLTSQYRPLFLQRLPRPK